MAIQKIRKLNSLFLRLPAAELGSPGGLAAEYLEYTLIDGVMVDGTAKITPAADAELADPEIESALGGEVTRLTIALAAAGSLLAAAQADAAAAEARANDLESQSAAKDARIAEIEASLAALSPAE